MIGEIPNRFRGTPQDFLDSAYYLSHYKIADGIFRMGYPSITESSAKISIGENGWALAKRLPDGGCAITVGVEGEDEVMWQTFYSYLVGQGWFDAPMEKASKQGDLPTHRKLLIGLLLVLSIAVVLLLATLANVWGVLPAPFGNVVFWAALAIGGAITLVAAWNNVLGLVEKLFGKK
jgi:hypothetical protein